MVDKIAAIKIERVKKIVGQLDQEAMAAIDRALLVVLGLA
jgi:mRNA-degrading endonuclease toxin of MazEF toxin-antitoxin module